MDIAHIPPRVAAVIRWVADEHKVSVDSVLGRDRALDVVEARRIAMRGVRCMTMADGRPPSFPRIGRWFDGRHHTTIMHHCARVDSLDGEQADLFESFPPISVNRAAVVVDRTPKRASISA